MDRFKSLARFLLKSELLKNASVLAFGTLIAQAIPILLQPILRRYILPEDFGVYSVYVSVVGILLVVSSLRYEQTIVLPKHNKDASTILSLSLIISFTFNLLLLIALLLFKNEALEFLNLKPDKEYIVILIPLGTFLISSFYAFNFWLIRKKAFMSISGNKLTRRIVEGLSQSLFAIKGFSKGLVFGDILGQLANIGASFYQSVRNGFSFNRFSWSKAKYLASKYSDFPKYSLIPSVMSAASNLLPVIFINRFFASEQAGYFDLSKLMLSIPLALVATSFSSVLLQRVSERYRSGLSIFKDLLPIFIVTIVIAIAEVLAIVLFGSELFALIFGETWRFSGEISKLLVWSFALNFIASSFTPIFVAMNRIKLQSLWQLIYFTSIISLVIFKNISFLGFLKIFVLIEVLNNLLLIGFQAFVLVGYERNISSRK